MGATIYLEYGYEQEIKGQAEDASGSRDTHSNSGRLLGEPEEDGGAQRKGITPPSQPEEVVSQTERGRRLGKNIAKHTRSGNLADA